MSNISLLSYFESSECNLLLSFRKFLHSFRKWKQSFWQEHNQRRFTVWNNNLDAAHHILVVLIRWINISISDAKAGDGDDNEQKSNNNGNNKWYNGHD